MNAEELPFSPACERNKQPILTQLSRWLPPATAERPLHVLEIGSGSGQHAVHMARHRRWLHWQPSEQQQNLIGLKRRIAVEGSSGLASGSRIQPPLCLDVTRSPWPGGPFDAVFSANTVHIMPAAAVPSLLAGSARVLVDGGMLLLYGPFRYGERHTSESNADFDAHLQSLDAAMGVRDAEKLIVEANDMGLEILADEAMPANNRMLIFRRNVRELQDPDA